jgi:hypothetical protein
VRHVTHCRNCHHRWPEFKATDSEANNLPNSEKRRGQEHVVKAGRRRRRVCAGPATPARYGQSWIAPIPISRGGTAHSSVARLDADARESHRLSFRRGYALLTGRCPMRVFKGMNGGPTSRSIRPAVTEHGMAYRPRGLRSRSRGSSRGSHAPPGHTGEPCTGQSTTGGQSAGSHAVREMRRARVALALRVTTGELTEIERFMVSSERGGWKSAHRGNSLAAYSTACTVLQTSGGSDPFAEFNNSHQPTRQRERRMQRFKSPGHAQRFLSASGPIAQHFRPRRHRFAAPVYRQELRTRFQSWREITVPALAG